MVLVAWSSSGQHYKVTMSGHCHKSVPIVIWVSTLPGCKTSIATQQTNLRLRPYFVCQYLTSNPSWLTFYVRLLFWCHYFGFSKLIPFYRISHSWIFLFLLWKCELLIGTFSTLLSPFFNFSWMSFLLLSARRWSSALSSYRTHALFID